MAKNVPFLHADNDDSNQPARMRMSIFNHRWANKVRFLTLRLLHVCISLSLIRNVNPVDICRYTTQKVP